MSFMSGFISGAAESGADIMQKQREFDLQEAAKAAELERREHFAKYQYDLGAEERKFNQGMEERKVGAIEMNAKTSRQNADTSQANLALRKDELNINKAQGSGQYGIDPDTGEVIMLSREQLASGKYKQATPQQIAKLKAEIQVAGEEAVKTAKFEAAKKWLLENEEIPEEGKEAIMTIANQTGVDPHTVFLESTKAGKAPTAAQAEIIRKTIKDRMEPYKDEDPEKQEEIRARIAAKAYREVMGSPTKDKINMPLLKAKEEYKQLQEQIKSDVAQLKAANKAAGANKVRASTNLEKKLRDRITQAQERLKKIESKIGPQ